MLQWAEFLGKAHREAHHQVQLVIIIVLILLLHSTGMNKAFLLFPGLNLRSRRVHIILVLSALVVAASVHFASLLVVRVRQDKQLALQLALSEQRGTRWMSYGGKSTPGDIPLTHNKGGEKKGNTESLRISEESTLVGRKNSGTWQGAIIAPVRVI